MFVGKGSSHYPACLPSLLCQVGSDKDGVSVAKVVLAGLVQHSCGFNEARLRSLPLCMVGGDGANVGGGPRALHSSTRASEKLWDLVYTFGNNSPSNPMVLWDGFHRANTAYEKCVADHQFIAELLACAKAMNASFGVGPGQVVYRSTAAELDIGIKKPEDMGGTRVLIATLNVPANLLNNLQGYVAGLHMKIHRRQRGKGSNTQTSLATIGRRLSSVDFVAFALAVDGVFGKVLRPFAQIVQRGCDEPWVPQWAFEDMLRKFHCCALTNVLVIIFSTRFEIM